MAEQFFFMACGWHLPGPSALGERGPSPGRGAR